LIEHLIQFALCKNHRGGVRAVPVIHKDRSRHKLRDSHKADQQEDSGEHHLEDAEAPLSIAKLCR